jgi:hypothetical protein
MKITDSSVISKIPVFEDVEIGPQNKYRMTNHSPLLAGAVTGNINQAEG